MAEPLTYIKGLSSHTSLTCLNNSRESEKYTFTQEKTVTVQQHVLSHQFLRGENKNVHVYCFVFSLSTPLIEMPTITTRTDWVRLFGGIIAVYSANSAKRHALPNLKTGDIQSNYWALILRSRMVATRTIYSNIKELCTLPHNICVLPAAITSPYSADYYYQRRNAFTAR
jgi:hypothetical protein